MRVLGVDPGLRLTGYGCVESAGPGAPARVVEAGVIRLKTRLRGPDGREHTRSISDRLLELERDLVGVIERVGASRVAVEALFAHYRHPATAIAMGHARGVILLVVRRAGLELVELRPGAVKAGVTGFGQAGKAQVQRSVRTILGLEAVPEPPDVADALAIALCALHRGAGADRRGGAGLAVAGRSARGRRLLAS